MKATVVPTITPILAPRESPFEESLGNAWLEGMVGGVAVAEAGSSGTIFDFAEASNFAWLTEKFCFS